MNTTHFHDLSPADQAFVQQARQQLRASESLNYVESARLAATRAQARELLGQGQRTLPGWGWLAVPAMVAAVALSLFRFELAAPVAPAPTADVLAQLSSDVNAPSPDALVWVSDEAGPDFYRDLEFYEWLQSRSPAKPNA